MSRDIAFTSPSQRSVRTGPGLTATNEMLCFPVLSGQRLREVLPGGVARAGHDLPVRVLHAVVPDQVHDASATLPPHDRQRRLQTPHVAHELELPPLHPGVFVDRLDDAAGRGAGIIDQDVDATEVTRGCGDELLSVLALGEIGGNGQDLPSGFAADLVRRRFERFLAARADRDVRPLARQRAGDALADAETAAGDQRDLARQLQIHESPPDVEECGIHPL